jgi:acyl carrier protein
MHNVETIKKILTDYFADPRLDDDFDIIESHYLDSLRIAELIVFIESKFDIDIFAEDITRESFRTIATIGDYISKKTGGVN